jgi:predicted transposase YdaD
MMQGFKELTREELRIMLGILTPLEETRAYKDIFSEGKKEGKKEGQKQGERRGEIVGRIKTLREMFEQGDIPESKYLARVKPLEDELQSLNGENAL